MSKTFTQDKFAGGAGLATGELASYLDSAIDNLTHSEDGIIQGGIVTTDTHTQAAGTGETRIIVDVANLDVFVDGVFKAETSGANLVIHETDCLVALGESVYAWIVEKNDGGTLSLAVVLGAAAADGEELIPTDAQIGVALGSGVKFVKVCLLHYNRSADTTLDEVIDMTYRQPHGVAWAKEW